MASEAGEKKFQYTVASVDRAIELLLVMESASRDMGITELSKILGVQKSTVHNLVQTMMARDFIRQTDSGRFTLGFRLVRIGVAAADRLDLRRLAEPILRELAAESNEYVLLAVLHRNEVTIVDSVAPQRSSFIVPRIDFSHTFHCTALGKIFLAYSPIERRHEILSTPLAHFTPYTLVSHDEVLREIDTIRQQGYAVSCNETIEGVTCLGAPIFNTHGKLEAAVSISTASAQLSAENYNQVSGILKEKAAAISRLIGF